MIVVVCGSRNWGAYEPIHNRLQALPGEPGDITIIHGACSRKEPETRREVSADMLADRAARELGFTVWPHPADWRRHGKGAGPMRNRQMLDRCPDLVLAFQRNGSSGTADTIRAARMRGIDMEVHEA